MEAECPIERDHTRLRAVGKCDLDDAVAAAGRRIWIGRVGEQKHFSSAHVACDIQVTDDRADLTQEIHVTVEELDALVAPRPARVPTHEHAIVRRDLDVVEAADLRRQHWPLRVGAEVVGEDLLVVAHQDEMVAVEADV